MLNWCRPALLCFFSLSVSGSLQAVEVEQVTEQTYIQQVEKWRAEHESRFRAPGGWLALVGHFWLAEGDNPIGTDPDSVVRLPEDAAQSLAGVIRLNGSKVSLTVNAGGPLRADGQEARQVELPIDAALPESDCPVVLEIGDRLKLQLVRRVGRYAVRVRDSQSSLIRSFEGKRWFAVNPEFRLNARYEPLAKAKTVKITNIKGDEVDSKIAGTLHFQWQGRALTLDAIEEAPGSLFVIFKDLTNGQSTYGAGRFVDVTLPTDQTSPVVLDFNKAYSPPCAWSPHTLCPLPPKQNHLPMKIEAGEKDAK